MARSTRAANSVESSGFGRPSAALLFGVVFTLVGVVGPFLGGGPEGELIVFGRNYLHDGIHLASGIAGIATGLYAGGRYAGTYLRGFGAVYLAVTVAGLAVPELLGQLIHLNMADNVLHLVLGVVLLAAGFGLGD